MSDIFSILRSDLKGGRFSAAASCREEEGCCSFPLDILGKHLSSSSSLSIAQQSQTDWTEVVVVSSFVDFKLFWILSCVNRSTSYHLALKEAVRTYMHTEQNRAAGQKKKCSIAFLISWPNILQFSTNFPYFRNGDRRDFEPLILWNAGSG